MNLKKINFKYEIIHEDAYEISLEYLKYFKKLKNTKFLITGGGGFLLSYFIDIVYILNNKFKLNIQLDIYDIFLHGLGRRFEKYKNNKYIKFIKKDVSKKFNLNDNYSLIIHGASIASPTFYKKYPIETLKVNTQGFFNILDQIINYKKLKHFVYMSSSEVYGDPLPSEVPTKETYNGNVSIVGSRACYDESKRIGETISVNYFKQYSIPIKIIRPFNVYGPGQSLNDRRFMPDILSNLYNKKDITLFSNGKPKRSFCYIADQIRGILEVNFKGKNGESYNVGNNEELSMYNAAKTLLRLSKSNKKIIFKSSKQINYNEDSPNRRCPDLNKINELDNWKVKYNFRDGVKRTLEFYSIIK